MQQGTRPTAQGQEPADPPEQHTYVLLQRPRWCPGISIKDYLPFIAQKQGQRCIHHFFLTGPGLSCRPHVEVFPMRKKPQKPNGLFNHVATAQAASLRKHTLFVLPGMFLCQGSTQGEI